jgi:hypothetical protein
MSTLLQHTKSELRAAGLFDADADFNGDIAVQVTALMETFVAYGHSGASAERTLEVFNRVANHRQITPLTGADDEWDDPMGDGEMLQNKRNPLVFKDTKSGDTFKIVGSCRIEISFPCDP